MRKVAGASFLLLTAEVLELNLHYSLLRSGRYVVFNRRFTKIAELRSWNEQIAAQRGRCFFLRLFCWHGFSWSSCRSSGIKFAAGLEQDVLPQKIEVAHSWAVCHCSVDVYFCPFIFCWNNSWAFEVIRRLLGKDADDVAEESQQSSATWVVGFKQPASEYVKFRETLEKGMVALENVMLKNDICHMVGTVKVNAFSTRVGAYIPNEQWLFSFIGR